MSPGRLANSHIEHLNVGKVPIEYETAITDDFALHDIDFEHIVAAEEKRCF